MDGGRSRFSQEEDEVRRASKQLKIVYQGQDKEVTTEPEPQAWLPAPMLHEKPLMDNASLRDFKGGGGKAPTWLTRWRDLYYSLPIWLSWGV